MASRILGFRQNDLQHDLQLTVYVPVFCGLKPPMGCLAPHSPGFVWLDVMIGVMIVSPADLAGCIIMQVLKIWNN